MPKFVSINSSESKKQEQPSNINDHKIKMTVRYLRRIVDPLSVYKELVLVLSLRQVQDGHKVIVASETGKTIRALVQLKLCGRTVG